MDLNSDISDDFLKHFGAWIRLEPRQRTEDVSLGIQARVADPLWFLARQWQLGEFVGEDAGSAIGVELSYHNEKIERVKLGDGQPFSLEGKPPPEVLIEQERFRYAGLAQEQEQSNNSFEDDWRMRVKIGQRFEQFLQSRLVDGYTGIVAKFRVNFPIDIAGVSSNTDPETHRFVRYMAGKAIDGNRLMEAIKGEPLSQIIVSLSGQLLPRVKEAIADLKGWYEELYGESYQASTGAAWDPERLSYRFELHSPSARLLANEYRNGELDWYSVCGATKVQVPDSSETAQYVPTRMTFPGMPHARWWAMEDSETNLVNLESDTSEFGHLVFSLFSMIQGNDWLMIPLDVPVGSLTWIDDGSINVKNVFDETIPLKRERGAGDQPHKKWDVFRVSGMKPRQVGSRQRYVSDVIESPNNFLYVPASLGGLVEESAPIEEVHFIRDEGANMVWAVEQRVISGLGKGRDGHVGNPSDGQRMLAQPPNNGQEKEGGALVYRISSSVPPNWIPFIPMGHNQSVVVHRAELACTDGDLEERAPQTRLLQLGDNPILFMDEETIPRAGLRVMLTRQRVRWIDGKTYTWVGRKVLAGRGEGRSGLKFDLVIPGSSKNLGG